MELYHKYRPTKLEDMVGNEQSLNVLSARITSGKPLPNAFLFYGPTGCGKTTLARIIAQMLGAQGSDFREVDSADFRGIDTIREIRKQARFKPLEGRVKVWLIDECHKLTNDAQNALLKGLEDPPAHTHYILATTEPSKLLDTIKGRCYQCELSPLDDQQMFYLLRRVVRGEEEQLQKVVYEQIIDSSEGSPRNALQTLDQVLAMDVESRLEIAKQHRATVTQSIELCRALMQAASWKKICNILQGLEEKEAETIRRQVLGYCSSILLKEKNHRAAIIMEEFIEPFYASGFAGIVFACYSITYTS